MRKTIVIYDDSRIPSSDIRSITGNKTFGNIIFRRKSFKELVKNELQHCPNVSYFAYYDGKEEIRFNDAEKNSSVVVIYSDHQVVNSEEFRVLMEKSGYINEIYRVVGSDVSDVAMIMYPSITSFIQEDDMSNTDEYQDIVSDAMCDLSDINNFRQFITSGFDSRYFNELSGDEYTVVKRSDNVNKLKAEYNYYKLLPDSMKKWYAYAYDYKEDENGASYTMERFHMTDLAIRYVHGAIDESEFNSLMNKLFYFLKSRVKKEVSKEEYDAEMTKLYVTKVKERIEVLKSMQGYEVIDSYIKEGTDYSSIDDIYEEYIKAYNEITEGRKFKNILVVGHGDLCFSNILYNNDANALKFIDPKGANTEDELYMNPYYDIAKLSHSICGGYDFFNTDLFDISIGDDMKIKLAIRNNNNRYINIFMKHLVDNSVDPVLVRLFEASLFLSMLPLHMDRPKKVLGFIMNAVDIIRAITDSEDM